MANVWQLSGAALVAHSILFISIFDIYFTSPIERGMQPQYYSLRPPAKRLALFVADGLRADTVFSAGKSYTPYLREIIENRGRWGVSHTYVPTESRPGHVALIAGLYEDMSAVTRGWRENPVHFDSVFNQSRFTWAWGSPDILPMFRAGAVPGRVETFTYDSRLEDFAGTDPSQLDSWVFEQVVNFFKTANHNATLSKQLAQDKIVFFLHLLGLDTNGHSHKPNSAEVLNNLLLVDRGIEQIAKLFEAYYGDNDTAFVVTSDHGMTDWGSHGAGLPHETMTPLICWGAGIKQAVSASSHIYQDRYSEKWHLSRYERRDVEQIDIAPLMSTLIGVAIPVNSEGVLPLPYLHYNKLFLAESLFANARQLMEQMRVKAERMHSVSLPLIFRPFAKLSPSDISDKTREIETLIKAHDLQRAIDLTHNVIGLSKEGLRYYHTYHRSSLKAVIVFGFFGWMACVLVTILGDIPFASQASMGQGGALQVALLSAVVALVLFYQSSPLLYYLYHFLPLICWSYVWRHKNLLYLTWKKLSTNRVQLFKVAVVMVAVTVGLELLVLSFFHREVLSLLLVVVSVWPLSTSLVGVRSRLCAGWMVFTLVLAVFPLWPVVGQDTNLALAAIPGLLLTFTGMLLLVLSRSRLMLVTPGHRFSVVLLWVQVGLLGVASLVPSVTHWFFRRKEPIPNLIHVFSWMALFISAVSPFFGTTTIPGRLSHIALSVFTMFTLMSVSYETFFVMALCATLMVWLAMEEELSPDATIKRASIWWSDISMQKPKVVSILPVTGCHSDGGNSLEDVRRAWLCLFLGVLSFFGIGNIASINTFDPTMIYCFLTVFSPFVMGALLILKMAMPFIFVSSVFNVILTKLHRPLKTTLFLLLIMSDIMGLNFFFLVQDSGSWLEIGISISHYVIMMAMCIAVVILMGVARLLTGQAIVSQKIHV